jgi:hypothetical protein
MTENPEKAAKLSHDGSIDGNTEVGQPSFDARAARKENIDADQLRRDINAKIANPLAGYTRAECKWSTHIQIRIVQKTWASVGSQSLRTNCCAEDAPSTLLSPMEQC